MHWEDLERGYYGYTFVRDPDITIPGWLLLRGSTTLQERIFSRLVSGLYSNRIMFAHNQDAWEISPVEATTAGILAACTVNRWAYEVLSSIPFRRDPNSTFSDPELYPWLQDLATLIAREATQAFQADFYPGHPDVNPLQPEHVIVVMEALQREMDREGRSRRKAPAVFMDLPWERQMALAERRRYWYGQFGITPEVWETGQFSLWHVSKESTPSILQ